MSNLSDTELKTQLKIVQENLKNDRTLESELESAAKHLPAYIKIVKSHIDQLRNVLELENHNHRTLENAGLAAPVQQLIKLFNTLRDSDIQLLEDLAVAARNWQSVFAEDAVTMNSTQIYEETTT